MVGWLEGGRENGPATRALSTRSAAGEGSRCVRLLRRTCEEGRQAAPKVRVLIVLAEILRFVSRVLVSSCDSQDLPTRIDRLQVSAMVVI